ncbi:MAG TPA: NAD-dependent epimerase/dehydratase family protein [Gaiellaceae bacterium]|jgi:CDP-paratose 2-epimerase
MRVLVTGGAGFVGGNVAVHLAGRGDWDIVALDNLHRPGSELNLPRLEAAGVTFVRGDVREPDDLTAVGCVDALVECSAEPSVLAGIDGAVDYLVHTNLFGAYACLEHCRRHDAQLVFLSTSRIYPHTRLGAVVLDETGTRFEPRSRQTQPGITRAGVSETFQLDGSRTLYGATKLAAELLIAEYAEVFGLRTVVDRFGVIAGPWQMGRVDQGIVTFWLAAHRFGRPLRYIGFGGNGKQVRDVLHVDDAVALVEQQIAEPERFRGAVVNAGGGADRSISLVELTDLCRDVTGHETSVTASAETRPGDVPYYVSDCAKLATLSGWRPTRSIEETVADVDTWIAEHEEILRGVLG